MDEKRIEEREELESQETKNDNSVLINFLRGLEEIGKVIEEETKHKI